MNHSGFVCPFQIQGEKEDTIIKKQVKDINDLGNIKEGVREFMSDRKASALNIILPDSLNELEDNDHLLSHLIPFFSELTASIVEFELDEFLPEGVIKFRKEHGQDSQDKFGKKIEENIEKMVMAMSLVRCVEAVMKEEYGTGMALRKFINQQFTSGIANGITPSLRIQDVCGMMPQTLIDKTILDIGMSGAVEFLAYRFSESYVTTDTAYDSDLFYIATTPFYPKEFGRYSEKVSIVATRVSDFNALSREVRRRIRTQSNTVLVESGLEVGDIIDGKQQGGLWLPQKHGSIA